MERRDVVFAVVIGGAAGMLAQPVLANVIAAPSAVLRTGVFLGFILFAPLALFAAYLLGKFSPIFYQFAKFGAVGTLNTFIDFGFLNLAIIATGAVAGVGYVGFKGISFLLATTNSFIWNRHWTFSMREPVTRREATRFYGVALVGWIIDVAAASFVVNALGVPAFITAAQWANVGALAGVAASFLWNFLGYKFWVFAKAKKSDPTSFPGGV